MAGFHVTVGCVCNPGESHAPEKSYTRHLSFPTHFSGHNDLASPGLSIPTDSEHSMRFRHLSSEHRPSKIRVRPNGVFCIMKSAQGHLERRKPTCPSFFFRAMQWFESESSSSSRKLALLALICLLAGRLMAEMSFNSLYSVHLDSSDEGTHSRGKRGRDPAAPPSVRREKQREKIFHACRYGTL